MIFRNTISQNLNIPVIIGNQVVPITNNVKFLGLQLDHKLKWNLHLEKLITDLAKNSGILYQVKNKMTMKGLQSICHLFIVN